MKHYSISKIIAVIGLGIALCCFVGMLTSCKGKAQDIEMLSEPLDGPSHAYFTVISDFDSDYYMCQLSSHSYAACPEKNKYNGDMVVVSSTDAMEVGQCFEVENPEVIGYYQAPDRTKAIEVIRGTKFNQIIK